MSNLFNLDGKTALILGGAGGIGSALAMGMGRNGAKVAVADMVPMEVLTKLADDIKAETGKDTIAHQVNVTSEESMSQLVQAVIAKFGTIDILVNAMGINLKRPALEFPMEDWDKMFNVNVKGTMIACKHVGQVMKEKNKGSIINLSSVRGIRGYGGGNSAYCGTKGAVELITKTLAIELAPFNVRINALGPALIITQGTIHIQQNPELANKYKALIPMGRIGLPGDLVGPAVFLASDASGFITGQTLFVDGGATAS
jgi:NAD(P)-dependent dehydrogenase (short-subunit alcohol dehydrogenase family)